jgi:pimeloyl-ACP methyl ester carboxylesterase
LSVEELHQYASALRRNGFFGPDSYYMNDAANAEYGRRAVNDGFIDIPALFLLAEFDFFCECVKSRLADEMRRHCRNLTTVSIASGHWMAQEKPADLNAALAHWLAASARVWPTLAPPKWRLLD